MTTIAKNSGWLGYGELGTFTFGEEYAPETETLSESLGITEPYTTEIGYSQTESFSLSEILSQELSAAISENFSITDVVASTIEFTDIDNLSIPEVNVTEITFTYIETLSTLDEVGGEVYVTEDFGIGEIVVCTLTFSTSENFSITDIPTTEISEPSTDNIGFTESNATEYGLTLEEFLYIVESVVASIPQQYKRVEVVCPLSIPKTVRLHTKIVF